MTTIVWIVCLLIALWFVLKPKKNKQVQANLSGSGTYELDIVGESNYQYALEDIIGEKTEESAEFYTTAQLYLENHNKFDKNAVRVDIEGQTVGYLSRGNAKLCRKELKRLGSANLSPTSCNAIIIGGWQLTGDDKGMFGFKLDLPTS